MNSVGGGESAVEGQPPGDERYRGSTDQKDAYQQSYYSRLRTV
jgi:hypothetical protein